MNNVCFAYDNQEEVLHDVSCTIYQQEFVILVGENGAGKSTLLNLLLSKLKKKHGQIYLFEDAIAENDHYQDIAYISQNSVSNYRSFPTTIEEVVRMHLRHLKKEVDIHHYLKIVKLEQHANKMLKELSGGQLQRVAILLALLKDAKLIILDEPTTGVDKNYSQELFSLLKDLTKMDKTILMVTHHIAEVKPYIDRILLLEDGMCTETNKENA